MGVIGADTDSLVENVVTPQSDTYAHPNGVAEQTAITITLTKRTRINSIFLDLTLLTQNATIRVKAEVDGVNARTIDSRSWTTADDDGIYMRGFVSDVDVTVTIQSTVAEGAGRNIPYRVL